jgi:hypothetical protein
LAAVTPRAARAEGEGTECRAPTDAYDAEDDAAADDEEEKEEEDESAADRHTKRVVSVSVRHRLLNLSSEKGNGSSWSRRKGLAGSSSSPPRGPGPSSSGVCGDDGEGLGGPEDPLGFLEALRDRPSVSA